MGGLVPKAREEGPEVLVMTRDSIEQESELTEDYPQISLFSVLFNWLFSWSVGIRLKRTVFGWSHVLTCSTGPYHMLQGTREISTLTT